MSRYIDADAIKEKKWQAESEACFYALEDVISVTDIDEAPSIDIVRCKECRYYHQMHGCQKNDDIDLVTNDDDYCSYGERTE